MEFERKTGIRQSTVNKIINGKSNSIADRTWRDLFPFVKPYLPKLTANTAQAKVVGIQAGDESRIFANLLLQENQEGGGGVIPAADLVEQFRKAAIDGILDLDINPEASAAVAINSVLKFLKNLNLKD